MFSPVFRLFLITSEKVVPFFATGVKNSAFAVHMAVKYD